MIGQQRDEAFNEIAVTGGFDGHGELHGGSLHFDCGFCVVVHGAVDYVRPADELCDRARIEAEALFRDHGDETGAGFEIRVVKLLIALILLKVGGVGWRQKGALMVIEPPGNFRRTGILEIDDGILVAIEFVLVEKGTGAVQQAGVDKFHVVADAFLVEAGKKSG